MIDPAVLQAVLLLANGRSVSGHARSRFLTVREVAVELATSESQIESLICRGELPALDLGGLGDWRIERGKLEEFLTHAYEATAEELERRRQGGGDTSLTAS
jgi:excisionase family DNA binding protein